jgi:hypothetical protein
VKSEVAKPIVVKRGNVSVKIYRVKSRAGYDSFQVADYSSGRRILRSFSEEEAARQQAAEIADKLARGEVHSLFLKPKDKQAYIRPLERETALPFFHRELRRQKIRREGDCNLDDLSLVHWIRSALRFARNLQKTSPKHVSAILSEAPEKKARFLKVFAPELVVRSKPGALIEFTRELLSKHRQAFLCRPPRFYGEALERAVQVCDLVFWSAWLFSSAEPMSAV